MKRKGVLNRWTGGDWRHRGGCVAIVAHSAAEALRLVNKAMLIAENRPPTPDYRYFGVSWLRDYCHRDARPNSVGTEVGVWWYKEDGRGMYVSEGIRLI